MKKYLAGDIYLKDGTDATVANGTTNTSGQVIFSNIVPGTYYLSETVEPGYILSSINCDDGLGDVNILNNRETSVDAGDNVTCVIGNIQQGKILIEKQTSPNTDSTTEFEFDASYNSSFPLLKNDDVNNSGWLNPGSYTVTEQSKTGWDLSSLSCRDQDQGTTTDSMTANIDLDPGEEIYCIFDNTQRGTIVINKTTIGGNGIFDFTSDLGNFSITTSGNAGSQTFSNVLPGEYEVSEDDPTPSYDLTNLDCVDPNQDSTFEGSMANIDLDPGETVTCTFTNTQRGSIQGKKFEDINNNGSWQSGEPYLNTWTIRLYQQGDGEGWSEIKSMVTGDDSTEAGLVDQGQYRFINLIPGTYYVCEDLKSGWIQTKPILADGIEHNGDICYEITVTAGNLESGKTFGNFKLGKVQGMKFEDEDGDGSSHESGEDYLNEWSIRLYDSEWNQIDSMNTGDDNTLAGNVSEGQFKFINKEVGTYYVCEVLDLVWTQTWPSIGDIPVGDDGIYHSAYGLAVSNQSSDADNEGPVCWRTVIESSGEFNELLRFGNTQYGSIDGHKVNDLNGNGDWDNEPVLEPVVNHTDVPGGVVIFIDTNDNQVLDNEERSTNTDNDGYYKFDNLLAGVYDVCEVLPEGWINTFPSNSNCHSITVTSGQTAGYDFRNIKIELDIDLAKSNTVDGSKVTYTLVVTNTGNQDLNTVKITDALPGGFSYVSGSSKVNGIGISDPSVVGGALVWEIDGLLKGSENSKTLTYEANIASDLKNGTYSNIAYALGTFRYGRELFEDTESEISTSNVLISLGIAFSGTLTPQVLGASTELPATGNPTVMLVIAILLGLIGISLKIYERKGKNAKN